MLVYDAEFSSIDLLKEGRCLSSFFPGEIVTHTFSQQTLIEHQLSYRHCSRI